MDLSIWIDSEYLTITAHLAGAMIAGGVIGIERSFHGRPAGFRTHALVCVASGLLMLVTLYQWRWLPGVPADTVKTDPTRMAQGIMTGIGFLGAGVIYKEGFSVRGLTTAASIWITAAIGILFGVGFYFPAILATFATIGILSAFRWIENKMPSQSYAHHNIRFDRKNVMSEEAVIRLMANHGFSVSNMSYKTTGNGLFFEYQMILMTTDMKNASNLATVLLELDNVRDFRISPTGD